ncbi:MAG: DUF2461 domain-containing protein [Chitinophagaceae bacterium]
MALIEKSTLHFLKNLKNNNQREWFLDHKKEYDHAKENFILFVDDLIKKISAFDPSIAHHEAKKCVFRINRDIRFSKDKSPYKTNFGAHITSALSKSDIHSKAGYYIHLEPGKSFLAGGAYLPATPWLKAIRQEIDYNTKKFKQIIENKNFKTYFGAIQGEKLVKAPKEYPKDHPEIELLKHKSFLAMHNIKDAEVLDKQFIQHSTKVFKALFPLDAFLNEAQQNISE